MTEREREWLKQRYRKEFRQLTLKLERLTTRAKLNPNNKIIALNLRFMREAWERMRSEWSALDSHYTDD